MADIAQGKSHTFRLRPPSPMVGPQAVVRSRLGVQLEAPVATPDPVSTTVASSTTESDLVVADATGMAAGRLYRFAHADFGSADRVVDLVDGTTVRLAQPLPIAPPAGTTVLGIEVAVAIGSASTTTLAQWHRLIVTAGDVEVMEVFNVVAHPYRGPVEAHHVRDWMARHWQGERPTETWLREIAELTNDRIYTRLFESDEFLSSFWSPKLLEEIGSIQMRLVLSEKGYGSKTRDPEQYATGLAFDLRDRIAGLLRGAAPKDKNNDGQLTDEEMSKLGRVVLELRR